MKYFDESIAKIYVHSHNGFVLGKNSWSIESAFGSSFEKFTPEICSQNLYMFLNKLLEENKEFNTVEDFTRPMGADFCFNIQLIKDDFNLHLSHSICVNVSRLIPYFHIHVLVLKRKKNNFAKWDGLPERSVDLERGLYKHIISKIEKYNTNILQLTKFPEHLIDKVVKELYTEKHNLGELTYYNAFFMDNFYTR